jgi:hypothetical protein
VKRFCKLFTCFSCLVPRRLFVKNNVLIWRVYTWSILVGRDGEGADGKSALELRDAWQFLVDFLQESRFLASCAISLSFTIFCYLFLLNWLMLIFFCHLGVNSCCYSWYIWYMPYLKSMEIPILTCQQPKRWRTRLAGTRFVSYNYIKGQTIKLHCCNKYFKLYGCELLFTWAYAWVRGRCFRTFSSFTSDKQSYFLDQWDDHLYTHEPYPCARD